MTVAARRENGQPGGMRRAVSEAVASAAHVARIFTPRRT
jgi:hypothetical protein